MLGKGSMARPQINCDASIFVAGSTGHLGSTEDRAPSPIVMFDEGPRPDMVIRTRGAILGRTKVTSRAGDEDAEVAVDLQASHRSFCRSHSGTLNESTNVGVKTGRPRVGGPELCV